MSDKDDKYEIRVGTYFQPVLLGPEHGVFWEIPPNTLKRYYDKYLNDSNITFEQFSICANNYHKSNSAWLECMNSAEKELEYSNDFEELIK